MYLGSLGQIFNNADTWKLALKQLLDDTLASGSVPGSTENFDPKEVKGFGAVESAAAKRQAFCQEGRSGAPAGN